MLIDTHCHLNFEDFKVDFSDVLANAKRNGVEKVICISTKYADTLELLKLSTLDKSVFLTIGVHPCNVHEEVILNAKQLIAISGNYKVVGLGETGLDYYHSREHIALQKSSFAEHIQASQKTGLPVIVHTRDADYDTFEVLSHHMHQSEFSGVIHCFTGSKEFAHKCLDLGLYISFSGIVTFKNAHELHEIAASIPLERLLIETDAPYLAPVPYRGRRNEPAYVRHVAEFIAKARGLELGEFIEVVANNSHKLFSNL